MATEIVHTDPDELPELEPANQLPQPAGNLNEIVEYFKLYQQITREILDETDYQEIEYTDKNGRKQKKKFKKKSAFRKYQVAFNVSDEILSEKREEYNGYFVWRIKVLAYTKNRKGWGVGACASNERGFAHLEHDVYATAHTRAKNRAVSDFMGAGEVSAEEMEIDHCKCEKPQPSVSGFCMNGGCGRQVKK